MRQWRWLGRPVVWLPAVSGVLAAVVLASGGSPERGTLSAWAFAMSAAYYVVPLFAAAAAWESARLVAGGLTRIPASRLRIQLVWRLVWPLLVGGLAVLSALGVMFAGRPAVASEQAATWAGVTAGAVTLLAAFLLVGVALGFWLRPVLAVPAALLAAYLWLALPGGTDEPVWVRHLVAIYDTCCAPSYVLGTRAVAGALAISVGLGLAGLVVACSRARWRAGLAAAALIVAGALVGAQQVQTFGYAPVEPRAGNMSCYTEGDFTLCAWPEHERYLPVVAPRLFEAGSALRTVGLSTPATFTEQVGVANTIGVTLTPIDGVVEPDVYAVADGIHPGFDPPDCADTHGWPAAPLVGFAWEWLVATMGGDPHLPADEERALARLLDRPADQQLLWYEQVVALHGNCDEPAPELWP